VAIKKAASLLAPGAAAELLKECGLSVEPPKAASDTQQLPEAEINSEEAAKRWASKAVDKALQEHLRAEQ